MNICFIAVAFLYVISDVVLLQSPTDDPSITISAKNISPVLDKWETNPDLKSLWVFRPPSLQSQQNEEHVNHRVVFRTPYVLTRLAKPLSYGFDPFILKMYHSKPVSSEVAELQSAFNDISNFWQDDNQVFNL